MKRRLVSSGSPYESRIGFSRAVRIGNLLAVSGTAPLMPDGSSAFAGDMYRQTLKCLEIVVRAAEQGGARKEDIIRTRLFLTDVSRWEEAARAHGEFFRDVRPASTFVGVAALLRPEWLVEVEADCVLPGA